MNSIALLLAAVSLTTKSIDVRFADAQEGFAVTGIVNRLVNDFSYIRSTGTPDGLWRLTFKKMGSGGGEGAGEKKTINNRAPAAARTVERTANALVFRWQGIDLPDAPAAVDVTVRVAVDPADDRLTLWTIEAVSHSEKWALFSTCYPVLASPLVPGEGMVMQPSGNLGARYLDTVAPGRGRYFNSVPMVTCFDKDGSGLYVAARDGEMRVKSIVFGKANTVCFDTPVENAGVAGKAANGPKYPVCVGVYAGDWWTAAKIHRAWAEKQVWLSKGRLKTSPTYTHAMSDIPLWFNIHGDAAQVSNALTRAHELFPNFKAGMHWHLWQHSPHDVNYPEYFPERPGTIETIAAMNEIGQVAMPYINGRRWSEHMQGFTFAKPYAVKNEDGSVHATWFKPAPPLASMCPYRPEWRGVVSNLAHRILDYLHAPAIFIDEVGNEPCKPCFDPTHGHPLGGGTWWAEGCRATLEPIQREYHKKGAIVTTEGSTEALIGVVDGFLIVHGQRPSEIPWYTAVYSGYATYFCSPSHPNDDAPSFWMRQSRDLLRGVAIGWFPANVLKDPWKVVLIRRACEFRQKHLDYFAYGELMDEFRPAAPVGKVTGHWRGRSTAPLQALQQKGEEVSLPTVIGNVWKSSDGSKRLLFLSNLSGEEVTVTAANKGFENRPVTIGPYRLAVIEELK